MFCLHERRGPANRIVPADSGTSSMLSGPSSPKSPAAGGPSGASTAGLGALVEGKDGSAEGESGFRASRLPLAS